MRLSFNWLCDFVDLSGLTPQEVADKLTMGAFEVEELKRMGPDITGSVTVGEIVAISVHPNAEKIRLTKVICSPGEEPREIVCGAWNIEVGHRIPVALPGAKVINRKDGTPLHIVESKIRGVTSHGMLCSAPELGIAGNGEGILILDSSTPIGADARDLLHLNSDWVFYVEPRSNRGDALSVAGLAREVAALCARPLKGPGWTLGAASGHDKLPVTIENQDDCLYFTCRVFTDVKVGPSPAWLVERLEAVGSRSINNVVDITNYVMHEYGQPLHAYDMSKVVGPTLAVRRARAGETITTIDDKERKLTPETLIIADAKGPVGVAGVMGGKGSEVSDATTTIALEAACFASARVRRSSRTLGLSSESSLRFERGVDVASVKNASNRAAALLVELAGAKLHELTEAGSSTCASRQVSVRMSEVKRLTDLDVPVQSAQQLLEPLGFAKTSLEGDKLTVSVPSWRQRDVSREADLVEEVCRLWGYDKVPTALLSRASAPERVERTQPAMRACLAAAGLNEAVTSSLVSLDDLSGRQSFALDESKLVKVLNPLSADHQVMRTTQIPGLLKAVAYNQDHGRRGIWLFEQGFVYEQVAGVQSDARSTGTCERPVVTAVISGNQPARSLLSATESQREAQAYFAAKGIVENLLDRLSINPASIRFEANTGTRDLGKAYGSPAPATPDWFHPGRSCLLASASPRGKSREVVVVGWLGEIHPAVAHAYGLAEETAVFELYADELKLLAQPQVFEEISTLPSVQRDLTVDVATSVSAQALSACITTAGRPLLRNLQLVSIYALSDQAKSLSFRLTYQHKEHTLTAQQVDENLDNIRQALTKQLSATFRA